MLLEHVADKGSKCSIQQVDSSKQWYLQAVNDGLHPGVQLQLLDSRISQGVGVLPLAAALCHAQEAVEIKGNNAWQASKPVVPT